MRHPDKSTTIFLFLSFLMILSGGEAFCGWEVQETGTTEFLTDICFVDAEHGWAVGHNSTIIRTTNGGETWEKVDFPDEGISYKFQRVEFVNPQIGYLIGQSHDAEKSAYKPTLLVTMDGGVTWEDRTPTNEAYGTTGSLHGLAVIDENTCYVTANIGGFGSILRTRDGGKTWDINQYTSINSFWGIDFCDKETGWAMNIGWVIDAYGGSNL